MAVQIINGNALEELKKLPDESIDCIITSPPYYGLRAYKNAEIIWGGDLNCKHEFSYKWHKPRGGGDPVETTSVGNNLKVPHFEYDSVSCIHCGAWKGQLGLEPTYQMYIDHLLLITKELKRILKKTGTLFWNMGDTYNGNKIGKTDKKVSDHVKNSMTDLSKNKQKEIYEKSLLMIPERFAIGMMDQGWILRNKIIWYKRNGMPSSAYDRFANKWEYIFFFVKSKKYYFDLNAVRKPLKESSIRRISQNVIDQFIDTKVSGFPDQNMNIKNISLLIQSKYLKDRIPNGSLAGRVMRNIADGKLETFVREAITNVNQYLKDKLGESGLTVKQLAEMTGEKETMIAHYFRTDISGTALPSKEFWNEAKDILKLDEYEKHVKEEYKSVIPTFDKGANPGDFMDVPTRPHSFAHFAVYPVTLIAPLVKVGCPQGGVVLDPFAGSGTTGVVAEILGRNSILIEISAEYIDIINYRLQPENLEKERKAILEQIEAPG